MLQGLQISYRDKNYRVQNANGWKHIIVTIKGVKKRIGVTEIIKQPEYDIFSDYILSGKFISHPCHAVQYWFMLYR